MGAAHAQQRDLSLKTIVIGNMFIKNLDKQDHLYHILHLAEDPDCAMFVV